MLKPMLAVKADMEQVVLPILVTPKLDGIRCLMVDGMAMSRSLKPIPNKFVRDQLEGLHGLDGELMLTGDFNDVQSGIMTEDGEPDFKYHVFDRFDSDEGYCDRINSLKGVDHPRVKVLIPALIDSMEDVEKLIGLCIKSGYEGLMGRSLHGPYKYGRSTVLEGFLIKFKLFMDAEATLEGVLEKQRNGNVLAKDELGHAKRSSHKANMIPAGTAGAVTLKWNGKIFKAGFGPGIDDKYKQDLWNRRDDLKGKAVTFRYQELSAKGIPRFTKMIGFRHPDDIT